MYVTIRKRSPGQVEFGIIYGGIVLLALFAARFLPFLSLAPSCSFAALTGFPCPTCGVTRSLVHLARYEFIAAFNMNPLFTALIFAASLCFFYQLLTLVFNFARIRLVLSKRDRDRMRGAAILLLLLNWIYLLLVL